MSALARITIKMCEPKPIRLASGIATEIPSLKVFVDGRETNVDMCDVALHEQETLPEDASVELQTGTKSYDLGNAGKALVKCLNRPRDFQSAMMCHHIAGVFLPKPDHPKQGWFPSKVPYTGDMSALKPFSVIRMLQGRQIVHSAVHMRDGIFLSKMGPAPFYFFSDFAKIKEMYPSDAVHLTVLMSACDGCGSEKKPHELRRCTGCQQATYCSEKCQKKDWKIHKRTICDPARNPGWQKEMVSGFYKRSSQDIDNILKALDLPPKATEWIKEKLSVCNEVDFPCTVLEELNLLVSNPGDETDVVEVPNRAYPDFPMVLARLTKEAFRVLVELSASRMINFSLPKNGVWPWKTEHPIMPGKLELVEPKTYQFPVVLRCGSSSETGHFDFLVENGELSYTFKWNK